MIEIINGQIYDTDKAKAIHRRVHGKPGDNDYYSITLYYNYSTDEYFSMTRVDRTPRMHNKTAILYGVVQPK